MKSASAVLYFQVQSVIRGCSGDRPNGATGNSCAFCRHLYRGSSIRPFSLLLLLRENGVLGILRPSKIFRSTLVVTSTRRISWPRKIVRIFRKFTGLRCDSTCSILMEIRYKLTASIEKELSM